MEEVLAVKSLKVYYYVGDREYRAVDGVSFRVGKGEVVGIVGESGSGKTTLAKAIVGLVKPPARIVEGRVEIEGTDIYSLSEDERRKIKWNKVAYIPQNALSALNPAYKVWQQMAEVLVYKRGYTIIEARDVVLEVLGKVGLPREVADMYPHELSGGMIQRVLIGMAMLTDPPLLVADEPTTALDTIVQAQVLNLLKRLRNTLGMSIVLISHDISVISELADRILVMYAGQIIEEGPAEEILENPLHPYTQGLIRAVPRLRGPRAKLEKIPGRPPDPSSYPPGCRFHPRCPFAEEICRTREPGFFEYSENHLVRCWLYSQ